MHELGFSKTWSYLEYKMSDKNFYKVGLLLPLNHHVLIF
jgi:hypothetical protein